MSPAQSKKLNILVIDDDPKIRELIQAFFSLKNDEFNCVTASDAQQAMLKLSNQEFDIIIIDNLMPGKTGIDFALLLKKSLKYSRMPIVLMSGAFQQEDVMRAMENGIRDIIVKPFTLTNLFEKISPIAKRIISSH